MYVYVYIHGYVHIYIYISPYVHMCASGLPEKMYGMVS